MSDLIAFPASLQKLVRELARLPSIGQKSAQRLAYHLLSNEPELVGSLVEAMRNAQENIRLCEQCFFMTETERCSICRNESRDRSILCVVEKPVDVVSIERSGEFRGYYHVLHGLWAPLRGQGRESMRIDELIERVQGGGIKEIILATGATVEGDATALYIAKLLTPFGITSSRLAQGLPKGGELEYADDLTLSHAFSGRKVVNF